MLAWRLAFSLMAAACPQRIVSLAPSLTELVFALGAGAQVVGVTRFDNYPAEVAHLPRVSGVVDPEPESVLRLNPDFVISIPAAADGHGIATLKRLGVRVVTVPAATLADLWASIDTLGEALNRRAAAAALKRRIMRQLAEAEKKAATARGSAILRLLVVVGRKPLVAAGPGSFIDAILSLAGAQNVLVRGGSFPVVDVEAIAALDAEAVVDLAEGGEVQGKAFWQAFPYLRAVRNNRIIFLAQDTLVRPGPRLGEGLKLLADSLWPRPLTPP